MRAAGVRDWFPVSSRGDGRMLVEPSAGDTPVRLGKAHACLRQHHSLSRSSNGPPLLLSFPLSPLFPVPKVKVSIPELEGAICTCRSVRQTQSVTTAAQMQPSRCSEEAPELHQLPMLVMAGQPPTRTMGLPPSWRSSYYRASNTLSRCCIKLSRF